MRVTVFVPDELFARAKEVAARLGLNRSRLFSQALDEFVSANDDLDPVTEKLNQLADETGGSPGAEAGRRLIDSGAWDW